MASEQFQGVYFVRVKCIPRRCPNCGNPAPVNTLTTQVTCPECDAAVPIAPSAWRGFLTGSVEMKWCKHDQMRLNVGKDSEGPSGGAAKVEGQAEKSGPGCIHCGAALPVDGDFTQGAPVTVTCSGSWAWTRRSRPRSPWSARTAGAS
jgi:hypothetical protein